jgi:LPS O-antigen subunit length determinant protein (WzzB/FepE family)
MNQNQQLEHEIDLFAIWKIIIRYKHVVLLSIAIMTSIFAYYALTLPTVYYAEVLMVPTEKISRSSAGLSLSNLIGGGGIASTSDGDVGIIGEQALAGLQTYSFLTKYIKQNNLKPKLFHDEWNKNLGKWVNGNQPSDMAAFKKISKILTVRARDKSKANIAYIRANWGNPENIKDVPELVNGLALTLNVHAKQESISNSRKAIQFLKDELSKTEVLRIRSMLYELIESHIINITIANSQSKEFVFKVIDKATIPEKPQPSKTILLLIIGVFIGTVFGVFLAIMMNFFKK